MSGGDDLDSLFTDDHYCLCCGDQNPTGFKLKFRLEGNGIFSEVVIPKEYQGFRNVVHGGILGTLLDEIMVNLHWLQGTKVVTVEYQVRLKTPCPTDTKVLLSAWPIEEKRNLLYVGGQARLEDGRVIAESTAKCMKIN